MSPLCGRALGGSGQPHGPVAVETRPSPVWPVGDSGPGRQRRVHVACSRCPGLPADLVGPGTLAGLSKCARTDRVGDRDSEERARAGAEAGSAGPSRGLSPAGTGHSGLG